MNKKLLLFILAVVIMGGIFWFSSDRGERTFAQVVTLEENTVADEDYSVAENTQVVLAGGSTLTVEGNLHVTEGALDCAGGPLMVHVKGDATINDLLSCELEETDDNDEAMGISLVVEGTLTLTENAEIVSNGSIQIVDDIEHLLTTEDEIEALYDETELDTGDGQRIGPFVDDDAEIVRAPANFISLPKERITKVAHAQGAPPPDVITGKMRVMTPPKGVKQIVLFYFPTSSGVQITNFTLSGPDGRKGTDDKGGSCDAKGDDGENAFRFNAFAPNITVNNFTLNLGSGGDGGDAETTKDCKPGNARAGDGGKSGNVKMIAANDFQINGTFALNPGDGGSGGSATAHGKDGGPTEDGGDATARGGKGADNKKRLSFVGTVAGTSNIQVGDMLAGHGGFGEANPGTGGSGTTCNEKGGDGGEANATGGKGGDAKLTLGGSAVRAPLAQDIAGSGGLASATGAKAGDGGDCDPTDDGGDGGKGGDATAKEGRGGKASSGDGADGIVLDETGGDGGDGGDGCDEGKGGSGGKGDPKGEDGEDGKNLCILPPPTGVSLPPPPPTGGSVTTPPSGGTSGPPPPPQTPTIGVIQFHDYYIPINQLIISPPEEDGCPEDHWHAAQGGGVLVTAGMFLPDPNPNNCGYGMVSQTPAMEIPDPAFQ